MRGLDEFVHHKERKNELQFVEIVRDRSSWLLANWRQRNDKAFLLRYEELVRQPRQTLAAVFQYLELEANPGFIEEILQRTATNTAELQQHKTSQSFNSSVGRWKQDLSPDLQKILNREFAGVLAGFGYEI
jgi:sulfotransferase family protein